MSDIYYIIAIVLFLFLTLNNDKIALSVLIFLFFYRLNLNSSAFPIDLRGLLTIILFLKVFNTKEKIIIIKQYFLHNKFTIAIILFLLSGIVVSLKTEGIIDVIKSSIVNIFFLLIGFVYSINKTDRRFVFYGVLLAGFICVFDLLFSQKIGSLRVTRIIDTMLNNNIDYNHNYFGLISGLSLVTTSLMIINKEGNKIILLFLSIIYTLGIILSTSRSSILATISVSIVIFFIKNKFRMINISYVFILFFVVYFILIVAAYIPQFLNLSYKMDNILTSRLIKEPLEILYRGLGSADENTIAWRQLTTLKNLVTFKNMDVVSQILGIGEGQFIKQNIMSFDQEFAPHNGYILLLFERGIFGLVSFLLIILMAVLKNLFFMYRTNIYYPYPLLILFLLIYVIGQNAELTSYMMYFLLGSTITFKISNN